MRTMVTGGVAGFVVCQIATLVTTIYLHRALSHRSLALAPAVTWVFRIVTWLATGIRPRQWVAVHRKHHAFTDVDGDPHSPLIEGFAMVQFANVALYRRVAADPATVDRYARDIPADKWDRLLLDRALVGLSLGVVVLILLLGVGAGLLAAAVHTATYLLLNAAVNAVGHTYGTQPHPNGARNSQALAWVTSGEGLHNNHHAAPTSARLALAPGQVDPGWWLVRLLVWRGWATVRHSEVHLKAAA